MPMSIASALRHPNTNIFIPYLDNINLIPKGSLLSSKVIFNVVYNPDGTSKKFKSRIVARGD